MKIESIDLLMKTIVDSSGGLSNLQRRLKEAIMRDSSILTKDQNLRYIVGTLAAGTTLAHLKRWRKWLTGNTLFTFIKQPDVLERCHACRGTGEICWHCLGTKVNPRPTEVYEANYAGKKLEIEKDRP